MPTDLVVTMNDSMELLEFKSAIHRGIDALIGVLNLHIEQEITLPNGEWGSNCKECDGWEYPCKTIQVIQNTKPRKN
jgi:hypothetical protein